jgi:hypothetical protein
VTLLRKPEFPEIRETMLDPAHDISGHASLRLRNEKCVRQSVECVDEEVRSVILRKADSINVHDRLKVCLVELPQCEVLLNQQRGLAIFAC